MAVVPFASSAPQGLLAQPSSPQTAGPTGAGASPENLLMAAATMHELGRFDQPVAAPKPKKGKR